jgi:UDP-N-acetylmuramoyl-L-alanyl-D-glutamate--2,6-diaminopimelate ligase
MRLSELMTALEVYEGRNLEPDPEITGVTEDSRRVQPGYLFVAVRGGTVDGHRFIPQALAAGAAAVVGEAAIHPEGWAACPYIQVPEAREALGWLQAAWHGYPSDRLVLTGVTGTDGKTTTTNLLHAILTAHGFDTGMVSTVNARIGAESHDTGLHTTTPLAGEVQSLLSRMVAYGSTHAVLETTSHGLDQRRVAGCEFDVAVFTNITHEHLNDHGSWDAYFEAKARLLRNLTGQRRKTNRADKVAVLNMDDGAYARLREVARQADVPRILSYALAEGVGISADLRAHAVRLTPRGLRFELESPWGGGEIASPLVGLFNVSNILAAAAAALALGASLEAVIDGVGRFAGILGRMQAIDAGQPFLALVDFAHTPNALRRALEATRSMTSEGGRIILVFGSAGLRDRDKRWMMGEVAGEWADFTIVTAEDPRTESLEAIMAETQQGLERMGRQLGVDFALIADRGLAIRRAVEMARPGDVVIACGKGHEQSMCFGTTEYPWDEPTAMRLALEGTYLDTLPTSDRGAERCP